MVLHRWSTDGSLYVKNRRAGAGGDQPTAVVYPDTFRDRAKIEVG